MPLRAAIEDAFVIERSGWAVERVERVTAALQSSRPSGSRMETLVVWMEDYTAFTAPGDAIYLSRRLLEVLPSDAAVAFVIAHERAHHALGHVPNFDLSLGASSVRLGLTILGRWVHSTRHERDADLFAIEQCVAAGYDAAESIEALECLEKIALDYGHVDAVVNDAEARARARSHPPLRGRIEEVKRHVAAMGHGHCLENELRVRRLTRRRRAAIAAASAVSALALLLVLRRAP